MYINKKCEVPRRKSLLFFDEENERIVKYNCILRKDVNNYEIGYLYSSIYGMRLGSSSYNGNVLQDGKTACDVIHELEKIIESPVISFNGVVSLFNEEVAPKEMIQAPIKNLLNLFDIEEQTDYKEVSEISSAIECGKKESFRDSLVTNTKMLKDMSFTKKVIKRR